MHLFFSLEAKILFPPLFSRRNHFSKKVKAKAVSPSPKKKVAFLSSPFKGVKLRRRKEKKKGFTFFGSDPNIWEFHRSRTSFLFPLKKYEIKSEPVSFFPEKESLI